MSQEQTYFDFKRSNYRARLIAAGKKLCDECGVWYDEFCPHCKEVNENKALLDAWINEQLNETVRRIECGYRIAEELLKFADYQAEYREAVKQNENLRGSDCLDKAKKVIV